jgi:hypothetical protein
MPLSPSSLFHFTKTKESLYGILDETFKLSYCREVFIIGGEQYSIRAPMVSFCDIPLSDIKNHIDSYGSYGIGLSKEWGKCKKLNPVLYVEQDSFLSRSYETILRHFVLEDAGLSDEDDPGRLAVLDVLRYIKNYEGSLTRSNGDHIPLYRYSDEREWRYVPKASEDCCMILNDKDYETDEIHKMATGKLSQLRLSFTADDVRYIVIEKDSEINELVNYLKDIKNRRYSQEVVDRLTTRILTREQIMADF